MDIAYDHVQEEALSPSEAHQTGAHSEETNNSLNTEFQHAFSAVSASPWGSKLGGWFSQARKQGETFVADLQKEAQDAQSQATQGWSSLREQVAQRTRGMSVDAEGEPEAQETVRAAPAGDSTAESTAAQAEAEAMERPESLPADIIKEAGTLVASLRTTAAAKLKDLQKAEDAADEALLNFGTNVRKFLRDAVTISAPSEADAANRPTGTDAAGNQVLFETQEPGTGRKVFHTTRLDAQLHAIHTTASSFTESPQGPQWEAWEQEFDVESKTADIAHDLEQYGELRRAMEKLVPEKAEYRAFWTRYYFLRKAIEEEERRRREVLKGAKADPAEEEIAWDASDDEGEEEHTTPQLSDTTTANVHASNDSTTISNVSAAPAAQHEPPAPDPNEHLKPALRSHEQDEKSVADSEASYDMVSTAGGAASRGLGSPRTETSSPTLAVEKKEAVGKSGVGKEESDEDDDWE